MDTDRRSFLAGAASVAVVGVVGCSGGGEEEPRPPREDDGNGGNGDPARETAVYREVDALRPKVDSWEARENEAGNLTLSLVLNNINPDPVEGTMNATFATTEGQKSYTRSFTLAEDGEEVTMDVPVAFEEYNSNMSLPDFTFENVTER